jgi:hypothetical protein
MEKIKINTIVEIAGLPKEHVEKTMQSVVDKLKQDNNAKLIKHKTAEAKEKNKIWSTFTEFEIDFKSLKDVLAFCFNFMPSSVEITEPDEFKVKRATYQDLLNAVIIKMHQYDRGVRQLLIQNKLLEKRLGSTSSQEEGKKK